MNLLPVIKRAPLPGIQRDLMAVQHKLHYPMIDILKKIPGDTMAERARAVGVARQTLYVWMDEMFRPDGENAATIAKLTGVPIEHIMVYQEGKNDARTTVAKTAAKLADGGKATPQLHGRTGRTRRGMDDAPPRSRSVRAVHERASD